MVLSRHFARFQRAIDTGELILAGRTKEPGDKTFGIAIFEAKDEAGRPRLHGKRSGGRGRSDDGGGASVRGGASAGEAVKTVIG